MTTTLPRARKPSELLKRGYSEEEIVALYELGRFLIESGDLFRAEVVLKGLTVVAPDNIWPKTALSYIALMQKNFDVALTRADDALKLNPHQAEALLYKSTALLELGELSEAGMHLGELQDNENALSQQSKRLLKILLARFEHSSAK